MDHPTTTKLHAEAPRNKKIPFTLKTPNYINYFDAEGVLIIHGTPITPNTQTDTLLTKIELIVPIIVGLPGPIIEALQLVKHETVSITLSSILTNFKYELQNNGTVYANMTGELNIKGFLNTYNLPIDGIIYPEDEYTLVKPWTPSFFDFGYYSADLKINYGRFQQNQTLQTHDTILVIPIWLPILILILFTIWIIRRTPRMKKIKIIGE